jgi:hypothetical protein
LKANLPSIAGAAVVIAAVLFTLVALFVAVDPASAYGLLSVLFRVDLTPLADATGWKSVIGGLAIPAIGLALWGGALVWLCRRYLRE